LISKVHERIPILAAVAVVRSGNRLCRILIELEREYGNDTYFVHLSHDRQASVESFVKRKDYGIMQPYREAILMGGQQQSATQVANDYLDTVTGNIALFLKDRDNTMTFKLENAGNDLIDFWHWIGVQGELDKATCRVAGSIQCISLVEKLIHYCIFALTKPGV
jgi:hypothetical protein